MSIDPDSIPTRLAEIAAEAQKIDPRTAKMVWWYAQVLDPYGFGYEIPPEADCVGREYFLVDPERGGPHVEVHTVRAMHPEIDDEEWATLMAEAASRDDSPDRMPFFHLYRRRGAAR